MVKQDPIPRLYQNDQLITLPPGRRAHEMPDKVFEWHEFLKNLTNNFDMFFSDQLTEAADSLSSKEFEILFNDLEYGIIEALKHFEKWLLQWLHLPLAVCHLGGNNAQPFASSFYHVILQKPWISLPSDLELRFAQDLEENFNYDEEFDFDDFDDYFEDELNDNGEWDNATGDFTKQYYQLQAGGTLS
ncbi:unnamed protein product [Rhizophagus irregularis]|nr:unnamed protein product [Rhizophagus irregularis]